MHMNYKRMRKGKCDDELDWSPHTSLVISKRFDTLPSRCGICDHAPRASKSWLMLAGRPILALLMHASIHSHGPNWPLRCQPWSDTVYIQPRYVQSPKRGHLALSKTIGRKSYLSSGVHSVPIQPLFIERCMLSVIWTLLSTRTLINSKSHSYITLNTLRPRQNGRHFADDVFKCIFLN